jgi:outer membrane protein assembly factor BamB
MRLSRSVLATSAWLTVAVMAMVGFAPAAFASYPSTPVGPTGWVPDGPVLATVVQGDRVFVGGSFTGGVAALDAGTGAQVWTGRLDGVVRGLALSADGTHLIAGGSFTTADGVAHRRLASLRVADGTAEPTWKASASGMVRDIVVVGDTAYFGGLFVKHNGIAQRSLGAVSVTTGKPIASFTPSTDDHVYGLATNGARLFIAGRFTTVSGQPRDSLASVSLATSTLDDWSPPRACTGCNLNWDLFLDSGTNTLYAVGRNAGAVRALDLTTGAQRWRVTANGDAQAVTLADGLLYVGGHFTEIGSPRVPRTILAALNPTNGAVDPEFAPRFVTTWPGIWALATTDSRLYAAGHFTAAGPSPPKQFPYFAMFASN